MENECEETNSDPHPFHVNGANDMMKNQLSGLMQKAQQMQEDMNRAQEELARIEVEGLSGAGLVKVVMTCRTTSSA